MIAVAYMISVALYLRIMSEYVVEFLGGPSEIPERTLACVGVLLIVGVGVARGFSGLDLMERLALIVVLALMAVLSAILFFTDAGNLLGSGLELPPVPGKSLADVLLVLGGIVITVQGFETVRYLGAEYDRPTRILACRLSQIVSSAVYVGFVLVATPVMGLGLGDGPDSSLLDITHRVLPVLSAAIVITAVLSQFSAATADTVAAHGNLLDFFPRRMKGPRAYLLTGGVATLLVWSVPTFTLIVIASRAFAAYYALQCVVALRTSSGGWQKLGFGLLAIALALVTLLARPAA